MINRKTESVASSQKIKFKELNKLFRSINAV